jgi:chromosome segregation ATPase
LEQKNQESLNYYNEIQRLNQLVSELTNELQNAKNINENLNEQYDNLVKEFQLEQKMVDDLNQQTYELNNTLMSTTNAIANIKIEQDDEREIKVEANTTSTTTTHEATSVIKQEPVESEYDSHEKFQNLEENNRRVLEQMELELNEKNQECLQYSDEIKRLNQVVSDLNSEIQAIKNQENFEQFKENNRRIQEQMEYELSQKNQECLQYNDEIKRLNQVVSDLNSEIEASKNQDANFTELNAELNRLKHEKDELLLKMQVDREEVKRLQLNHEESLNKYKTHLGELNAKLEETVQYYESVIRSQNEEFKKNLLDEEQQQTRSSKELERLREHLIEMSDSYNKEAILAEEREKQLRLALSNAQQMIQQQGNTLESSRFEITS